MALEAEIQCDGSCHAYQWPCSKCDALEWHLMCDECRFYALQDAEQGSG